MGTAGGTLYPPKFRTCTPCTPQVKDAAYVKILRMTLTTRLHEVRTNLYPPLTKTFRRACRQRTLSKGPIVRSAPRSPPKLPFSGNWVRVIVPSWARRSSHHEHLDRFSRFCISHGCVQQTDRQADIQTDGRTDRRTTLQ